MKKGQIFLLIVMLLICSCATSTENVQKATSHYKLGLAYFNENNMQSAFIEFQNALKYNPEDKEVLYSLGVIYLIHYEEYDNAIEYFRKAINVDSNYSEAYNNLGYAYMMKGKYKEAADVYNKAVSNKVYRTPEKAYYNLGQVYYRMGQYDDSIEAYKNALKRAVDFYPAYYGIALSQNAKGKYGDSSTAITRAIELDPNYKGDRNKAIGDFLQKEKKSKGDEKKDITDYLEILKY
ncbi:MAG: tetratricopeptide repeat protein [Nitrospiraceae bacterium]|nr:tetratricopeptide repeat protein [Nitrospiraceae bacterium]